MKSLTWNNVPDNKTFRDIDSLPLEFPGEKLPCFRFLAAHFKFALQIHQLTEFRGSTAEMLADLTETASSSGEEGSGKSQEAKAEDSQEGGEHKNQKKKKKKNIAKLMTVQDTTAHPEQTCTAKKRNRTTPHPKNEIPKKLKQEQTCRARTRSLLQQ